MTIWNTSHDTNIAYEPRNISKIITLNPTQLNVFANPAADYVVAFKSDEM
jgi:hypothetical protein